MNDPESESTGRRSVDDRTVGRRTVLGASIAGLAGLGFAGTAASQAENELVLVCLGDGLEYAFEVDGQVEFGDEAGDQDEIQGGTTVTGVINGRGRDNYHFSGDITAFEITEGADDARVVLNGEEVDPDDLGDGTVDVDDRSPFEITIRALSNEVQYDLTVDGVLEQAASGSGAEVDEDASVASTLDEGEEHAYRFSGVSLWLEIPEGVAVFSVGLSDDGSTDADVLPHRLFVRGLAEDHVTYRFSVSGDLEFGDAAEEEDTDIPADERIDGNTVEGHVHAHDGDPLTDDYRFSGSISFERAEGPVEVQLKPNDDFEEDEEADA